MLHFLNASVIFIHTFPGQRLLSKISGNYLTADFWWKSNSKYSSEKTDRFH